MENGASALYDLRPKTRHSQLNNVAFLYTYYDIFKGIIWHFGTCAYLIFFQELEIDTTLMFLP